jgi:cobalt/nickel transport system permease protein
MEAATHRPWPLACDGRVLLALAGLGAATLAFATAWSVLLAGGALAVVLAVAARLPSRTLAHRLAGLNLLLVLLLLPLLLGEAADRATAGQLLARANALLLGLSALASGLDEARLTAALQRLHLPPKLVLLAMLTLRYVQVLRGEATQLRRAMAARGFQSGLTRHALHTWGQFLGMLLLRSLLRAERLRAAMACRGFTGRLPPPAPQPLRRRDYLALATGLAAACLALAWHWR